MQKLEESKAFSVFKYFKDISEIPRGSGNEKEISNYLVEFAKKLKLEVTQDEALNVIIKKAASKGYENAPTVVIQGHMDMVCEKSIDTVHDFEKDPIKLVINGDKIFAKGTTLGADDGIAVAYAMALLADDSIEHPALEILMTTDEERGMSGAINLSEDSIKGKILINIDTEEEGYLLVSCAGGIRTKSSIKIKKEKNDDKILHIGIRGLKGGHSGMEIDKYRGNANKLMGRVLKEALEFADIRLVSISGGSKNNAIPREADAYLTAKDTEVLIGVVEKFNDIFRKELFTQDNEVRVFIESTNENYEDIYSKESTEKVINLLYLYPNGVNTMSANIKNLTESSSNLGVVTEENGYVEFDSAVRSSVPSLKDEIVEKIKSITHIIGGKFETNSAYPAWEYKKDSKIRDLCIDVYKKMYNKDPIVYAIHAGVECGVFEEKFGELDMISFGPNIKGAHTPEENLSISSTERVWEYLLNILKNIDEKY